MSLPSKLSRINATILVFVSELYLPCIVLVLELYFYCILWYLYLHCIVFYGICICIVLYLYVICIILYFYGIRIVAYLHSIFILMYFYCISVSYIVFVPHCIYHCMPWHLVVQEKLFVAFSRQDGRHRVEAHHALS